MKAKIIYFSIVIMLVSGMNELTFVSSAAYFAGVIGTRYLPYMTIISSLMSPLVSFVVSKLTFRVKRYLTIFQLYTVFMLIAYGVCYALNIDQESSIWIYAILSQINTVIFLFIAWSLFSYYLSPFQSQTIFFYLSIASEVGNIGADLLIKEVTHDFTIRQYLLTCVGILCVILAFGMRIYHVKPFQFISENKDRSLGWKAFKDLFAEVNLRRLLVGLMFAYIIFDILGVIVNYQFNMVMQDHLKTPSEISRFFSTFEIISSLFVILVTALLSRFASRHLSATNMIISAAFLTFLAFVVLNVYPVFWTYVAADFMRGVVDSAVFYTAFVQIGNTLNFSVSNRFRIMLEGIIKPLTVTIASLGVLAFPTSNTFPVLNMILLVVGIAWLLVTLVMRGFFYKFHIWNIRDSEREGTARSIQVLGGYHNHFAIEPLAAALRQYDKDIQLKREIILSLGRIESNKIVPTIMRTVNSHSELIQNAALRALSSEESYAIQNFYIEFINGNNCRSFLVRETALKIIYDYVGDNIVLFLIPLLKDPDHRVVANAIESMGLVSNHKIIPVVAPFLNHENNRVVGNAVMVLYRYPECRDACVQALLGLSRDRNSAANLTFIYVVGKMRLYSLKSELVPYFDNAERHFKIAIAFALTQFYEDEGIQRFIEVFSGPAGEIHAALHHFLQIDALQRIEILSAVLKRSEDTWEETLRRLIQVFTTSPFNLDEEVDLLQKCLNSHPTRIGK